MSSRAPRLGLERCTLPVHGIEKLETIENEETINKEILTHRLCTLVSVALRFSRREFGLPGSPYIMAKLIELLSEIWSRRS